MTVQEQLAEAVLKGAAILDRVRSTWPQELAGKALKMGTCGECVCGYLWGSFDRGMDMLDAGGPMLDPADLGFFIITDGIDEMRSVTQWDYLATLWYAEIARRTAGAA